MPEATERIPVTVVVPIKNEALNLPKCLGHLGAFAHVLVVDSGSTDGSPEIARRHGAEVVNFEWNGQFPKKRNWCLRNYSFQTPWVLFLDADEQVTPEFTQEVAQAITQDKYNGFWVEYKNHFMGHMLKHGDPFRKLPLLRLGRGEYERIDEDSWSRLDMEVHEHLVIDGEVGHIKAPLIHDDFKGLSAYYNRHNEYSSWEAARYMALREAGQQSFTARQKLKYRLLESPWFPLLYFVATYVFKLGFLDGKAGFRFAVSKMFYFYQINFKVAEMQSRPTVTEDAAAPERLS
jgi:glycosyltransferase involved in cell wall biosynthesis